MKNHIIFFLFQIYCISFIHDDVQYIYVKQRHKHNINREKIKLDNGFIIC